MRFSNSSRILWVVVPGWCCSANLPVASTQGYDSSSANDCPSHSIMTMRAYTRDGQQPCPWKRLVHHHAQWKAAAGTFLSHVLSHSFSITPKPGVGLDGSAPLA